MLYKEHGHQYLLWHDKESTDLKGQPNDRWTAFYMDSTISTDDEYDIFDEESRKKILLQIKQERENREREKVIIIKIY